MANIETLVGRTIESIREIDDALYIDCTDGNKYRLIHHQNCCESVYIEDIAGDLHSLVGNPLLVAEERYGELPPLDEHEESYTWTFYVFATIKGHVDIRFYGSSNGYYSERVEFEWLNPAKADDWRGGWE